MTNVSRTERRRTTAGLDLGDKHSHLCLIDTESGEVIEERAAFAPLRRLSSVGSAPRSR